MEEDDFLKDEFLRELINRSPLDSPSDDFVDRVMAGIQPAPQVEAVKQPLYQYLKVSAPFVILALSLFVVIATSDIPLFNWVPGKDFLMNNLLPYLGTMLLVFKNAFSSKFVSWGLLIGFSTAVLFLIDRLFSRRTSL